MTRTLAMEWAKYGIQVNAVAPGYFKPTRPPPVCRREEGGMDAFAHSLRARGSSDDLAGVAVFLASPASDYMTGQAIVVDGVGWRIRN